MPYGLLGRPTTPEPTYGLNNFDPRRIDTLVSWWDANDRDTITLNGGNVSEWRDKHGAFHLTQATAANQPAYVVNAISGRSVVRWTNSINTQRLINAGISVALPTMFAVFRFVASPASTANGMIVFDRLESSSRYVLNWNNPNDNLQLDYGRDAGGTAVATTTFGRASVCVVALQPRSGNHSIYLNGRIGTDATTGSSGLNGISVGDLRGNPNPVTTTFNMRGDICELLVYNGTLSEGTIVAITRWLMNRWNVAQ